MQFDVIGIGKPFSFNFEQQRSVGLLFQGYYTENGTAKALSSITGCTNLRGLQGHRGRV